MSQKSSQLTYDNAVPDYYWQEHFEPEEREYRSSDRQNQELVRIDQCVENYGEDLLGKHINISKYGKRISALMLYEFDCLTLQQLNERFIDG